MFKNNVFMGKVDFRTFKTKNLRNPRDRAPLRNEILLFYGNICELLWISTLEKQHKQDIVIIVYSNISEMGIQASCGQPLINKRKNLLFFM